ncbi:SRPBCC domain-containing protein [Paenibacillus rhizovicinus]|uniref:SRPBCC domain-containing protein n=1 Tax=Paenibacillus rhizovicinus TaxID=2704463 RepID=A0A6C0NU67_9BACL|nr:SRPBCC domain-containing protein [Paenibacillus rhizovicinus]QHW29764.1 SRPBCC domain-containing protein [Paenibacillus rhizovicinus]
MSNNAMVSSVENDRVLVLERVFNAPRDLVFQMFKEAEHLKRWWGPKGWEIPVCIIDFRPGGVWHYCMKCVDENQGHFFGMESWGKGIYEEIVEPETIIYTDYFSDADGTINEAMPSTLIKIEFHEQDGKTKLVNRSEYASAEALQTVMDMGMLQGITETWDRLSELLESIK